MSAWDSWGAARGLETDLSIVYTHSFLFLVGPCRCSGARLELGYGAGKRPLIGKGVEKMTSGYYGIGVKSHPFSPKQQKP